VCIHIYIVRLVTKTMCRSCRSAGRAAAVDHIGIRAHYNSSDVEMTAHVSADVPCTIRFKRAQQHEAIAAAAAAAAVSYTRVL